MGVKFSVNELFFFGVIILYSVLSILYHQNYELELRLCLSF